MPLASVLRPQDLEDFIGQEHLIGKNGPLRILVETSNIPSMIFWDLPQVAKQPSQR